MLLCVTAIAALLYTLLGIRKRSAERAGRDD